MNLNKVLNTGIYKTINVSLDGRNYEILIGREILSHLSSMAAQKTKDRKLLIVADEFFKERVSETLTQELSQKGFLVYSHHLKAGKTHKNINEAITIYEILESNNFARDSIIIALGGGVIGDLVGFVASTYLRGINLIHIPTTLTAIIDSSIGGKVGINFRKTINAIGNYYQPILNVIDLQFLDTLKDRDFKAGLAEVIKCAIICDNDFFLYLRDNAPRILNHQEEDLLKIIYRTIEIKLEHVENDMRENNKRLKLNYGHTLGHAIESSTGIFEEIYRHGEGVALGMVGASYIAKEYLCQGDSICWAHEDILKKYDLPIRIDTDKICLDRIQLHMDCLNNIQKDKKRKNNVLRFILPAEIGRCEIHSNIPDELIEKAFHILIQS